MSSYLTDKLSYYNNDNIKVEILPAARCILELLVQSSTHLSESLLEVNKFTFPTNEDKIKKVQ